MDEIQRVTPDDLEREIASEHYFTALDGVTQATGHREVGVDGGIQTAVILQEGATVPLSLLTFCVLVLRNGCKVVGVNHGPVDPAGFDADYGRQDAPYWNEEKT